MNGKRLLIGMAGGSGSGKTTIMNAIRMRFGEEDVTVLEQDYYYQPQDHLSLEERGRVNFDHPAAFDTDLLSCHVGQLIDGQPIEKPVYDFVSHARLPDTVTVRPSRVIILEGILVLESKRLRDLMGMKIFIDTEPDLRFIRRLQRDIRDRGRTLESVLDQYLKTVRPMHLQFVEPSKRYADLIIPEGLNQAALDVLTARIEQLVNAR